MTQTGSESPEVVIIELKHQLADAGVPRVRLLFPQTGTTAPYGCAFVSTNPSPSPPSADDQLHENHLIILVQRLPIEF